MPENPLILFADPTPADRARRHGGASDFCVPSHQRQVERLSPRFNTLGKALERGRAKVTENPEGIAPEYTLVLEVAGNMSDFETAVRHLREKPEDIHDICT